MYSCDHAHHARLPGGVAWSPIYTTVEENEGVHGNNERITVKNVRDGTREMFEVVEQIVR